MLLAHELVRNFHRQRGRTKFCAKLDILFAKLTTQSGVDVFGSYGIPQHIYELDQRMCHFLVLINGSPSNRISSKELEACDRRS